MQIRRIVTGVQDGRAAIVSDARIDGYAFQSVPGFAQADVWATDGTPSDPGDPRQPQPATVLPPPGGTRFMVVTFPPDAVMASPTFEPAAAGAEYAAHLRDFAECFEPDAPGMHRTATVDYGILLSGQIVLEVDDEQTVALEAGDVVIQNGARHAWRNLSEQPAVMAFVLIGADRSNKPS